MTQLLSRPAIANHSPKPKSPIEFRIAKTAWERRSAFRLLYDHYLQAGLIRPNPFRLRVTPFHLLPTTQVFLAVQNETPICTVSLVADGRMGLPMEAIYGQEVNQSRSQKLFVGEVSALAGCTGEFRSFLPIFVQLTRLMAQYARGRGMDQFLIAVHPKHAGFYERFMGFETIGPVREYPFVQNAPAVACCLDFHRIDREHPKCWYDFFGTPLDTQELEVVPMDEEEFKSYQLMVEFFESEAAENSPETCEPREYSPCLQLA